MVRRKEYFEKLLSLKDKQIIKVVTGIRRCGKSTILEQFREHLLNEGVERERIVAINFEEIENEPLLDYKKLYDHIYKRLVPDKMNYIFLDEIQTVPQFQKAINSLLVKKNVDIYVTGSNAYMLSGELATLLSGRYIEISMLPLSFSEYFELVGGDKKQAFNNYFTFGGFPYVASLDNETIRTDYILGIHNTVILKDVVERKKIADVALLKMVIRFLIDNIGNIVSPKKIADTLTSNGRSTTAATVDNYIEALMDCFLIYKAGRYDIKGKQHLKSLEKYYLVDMGFRQILTSDKRSNIGYILENIVYLELLRRGYTVTIGKVDTLEIDFIAQKGNDKTYYQVSASVLDPTTYAREIAPFKKINDHHPKYIISMDELPMTENGIKQTNIIDFLLKPPN